MYYNGVLLVEASKRGQYIIGMDTIFKSSYRLSNHKVVKNRRFVMDMRMNPWGPSGESYKEICNHFSKNKIQKYLQRDDATTSYYLGVKPGFKYDGGENDDYTGEILQRKDILTDLKKLGENPIKIRANKDFFQIPHEYEGLKWANILNADFYASTTHFISKDLLLDDVFMKEIKKPYYYIEILREVKAIPDKLGKFPLRGMSGDEPQIAFLQKDCLQFDSEEEAIEYAMKHCGNSPKIKGFEIKISEEAATPEFVLFKR